MRLKLHESPVFTGMQAQGTCYLLFGRLSDWYGRQRIIVAGLALSAVSFLPLYAWIREAAADRSWAQVVVAVTLQIVFSAMVYAPTAAYLTELFPPR